MSRDTNSAAYVTLKFILVSLLITAVTLAMGAAAHFLSDSYEDALADGQERPILVVIDAGLGGEDGGCSGADGTYDKDVNLDVAERIRDVLSSMGIKCVMTRTEDTALYDMYGELSDYTGQKKTYDLKNRLRFAEGYAEAVFVSVHMNAFPDPSCRGVQIYYSPNSDGSRELAEAMRSAVKARIQPENNREIKRAGSSIYILNRITRPAVLIECGFLSNPEECAALGQDGFKERLALVLAEATAEYVVGKNQAK